MTPELKPIETEEDYGLAVRALSKRSRPPWVLRMLMNALEAYRQGRKMGWSRPQNKDGVNTFASFALDGAADRPLIAAALGALERELPLLTQDQLRFTRELAADPDLRGFVFVHDIVDRDRSYEGATVSLGRAAKGAPRHRDRLDVIVEREVVAGAAPSSGRLRAYVDPFVRPIDRHPAVKLGPVTLAGAGESLFRELSIFYARYRHVEEKAWQHWTQDYIEYFGPRARPVTGTAFPTLIDEVRVQKRLVGRASQPPSYAPPPL